MSPETPPSLPKPKRGAPLGNKNRFVHGAYARRPEPAPEPENPSPLGRLSLVNEIAILRVFILRTAVAGNIHLNLEQIQKLLHNLSLAATALTRLVQTEAYLSQATGSQVQTDNIPWLDCFITALNTNSHASKSASLASPEDESADTEPPVADPAGTDDQLQFLLEQTGLDPDLIASVLPIYSTPGPKLPSGPSNPTAGHPPSLEPPVDQ